MELVPVPGKEGEEGERRKIKPTFQGKTDEDNF
jgi:hypothetical protein